MLFNFPDPKEPPREKYRARVLPEIGVRCDRVAQERCIDFSTAVNVLLAGALDEYERQNKGDSENFAHPSVNEEEEPKATRLCDEKHYPCANPDCPARFESIPESRMNDYKGKKYCSLVCVEDVASKDEKASKFNSVPGGKTKKWSRKFPDGCVECHTTERKHAGGGLCTRCRARKIYEKERRK